MVPQHEFWAMFNLSNVYLVRTVGGYWAIRRPRRLCSTFGRLLWKPFLVSGYASTLYILGTVLGAGARRPLGSSPGGEVSDPQFDKHRFGISSLTRVIP